MTWNPDQQVDLLNKLMRTHIAPHLPPGQGVSLILYPLGQPGVISYISNANRDDMRRSLRNLLERWDADAAASTAPREN